MSDPNKLPPGPFNLPPAVSLEDIDPEERDEKEDRKQRREEFLADYDIER